MDGGHGPLTYGKIDCICCRAFNAMDSLTIAVQYAESKMLHFSCYKSTYEITKMFAIANLQLQL